jgi:hypothetical protein
VFQPSLNFTHLGQIGLPIEPLAIYPAQLEQQFSKLGDISVS